MTKSKIKKLGILVKPKVAVYFSSYKDPSYLYIEIFNPSSMAVTYDIGIYIDTYDTSLKPDINLSIVVPAESTNVIEEPTSELDLGRGEHFVFISVTII